MIVPVQVPTPELQYYHGETEELSENDLQNVYAINVDAIWYWYVNGGYEGSGQMLILKGEKWALEDLGHCSCYGPTDTLGAEPNATLKELWKNVSGDYRVQVLPLFQAADPETKWEIS